MLGLVSVETGLDKIKAHLQSTGYSVIDMAEAGPAVEAVIYSGGERVPGCNLKSTSDLFTVMVNATGLTPEQVAEELAVRMGQRNVQELPEQP